MISFSPPAGARSFGSSILPVSKANSMASKRDFASLRAAARRGDADADVDDADADAADAADDDDVEERVLITRDRLVRYARRVQR